MAMMRVTLKPGHAYKTSSSIHKRNRRGDLKFASSLGVAERTPYATERDVEHERRAAASPHHRRIGSSEPGVVGEKVMMQTGEFAMLLDVDEGDPRVWPYCPPICQRIKHKTRT